MIVGDLMVSETVEWETPQALFDKLNSVFHFDLDPCSTSQNAKCERHYTLADNGLEQTWNGTVFCNPPYGRELPKWVRKASEESRNGSTIVMLIPARPDTSYWHDIIFAYCKAVLFIRGRLHFGGSKQAAPFASAIIVFSDSITQEQEDLLSSLGFLWVMP